MQNIVELIRLDGRKALESIYKDHRGEFIQWARHQYQCQEEESREVFQQAVVTLYENIVQGKLVELTSSLKTYLFAIGKNKILELRRYQHRQQSTDGMDIADEIESQLPDDLLETARQSVSLLPDPCKSILLDFYYHGKSMQQLALAYGYKNEDTVKSQKYRCLQSLRKIFYQRNLKSEA